MIREHPPFQRTAIIFISAVHLTDVDRLKGYERGAVDYISVPVIPELLRAKVTVFAELYRKNQQLESLNRELEQRVLERTEELRESEAQFRSLANSIPQLAWMADSKGNIFWYNQRWYDYTGTTSVDVRGSDWKMFFHPEHVARVRKSLEHSWNTGQPWEDTFPLRGKDGTYRWFSTRAQLIRDADRAGCQLPEGLLRRAASVQVHDVANRPEVLDLPEPASDRSAVDLSKPNLQLSLRLFPELNFRAGTARFCCSSWRVANMKRMRKRPMPC